MAFNLKTGTRSSPHHGKSFASNTSGISPSDSNFIRGDSCDNATAISTARCTNVTKTPVLPLGLRTVPSLMMYGRTFFPKRIVSGVRVTPPTVCSIGVTAPISFSPFPKRSNILTNLAVFNGYDPSVGLPIYASYVHERSTMRMV